MNYGLLTPQEIETMVSEQTNLINPLYNRLAGWLDAIKQIQLQTPHIRFINVSDINNAYVDFPNAAVNVLTSSPLNYVVTTIAGAPAGFQRVTKIDWSDFSTLAIGDLHERRLQADVPNANPVANTLLDTGLQFAVKSGQSYWFYALIPYTAAATGTGSRWVLDGPTGTMSFQSSWVQQALIYPTAYNTPAACSAGSQLINSAKLEGFVSPNANGIIKIRFASEVSSSAITAKAGAILEYRRVL